MTVRAFHEKAMDLAMQAVVLKATGQDERVIALAEEACFYETAAACLVPNESASEPTRSILFRSAASLAWQAGKTEAAINLIDTGLTEYTGPQLVLEFTELLDQITRESEGRVFSIDTFRVIERTD